MSCRVLQLRGLQLASRTAFGNGEQRGVEVVIWAKISKRQVNVTCVCRVEGEVAKPVPGSLPGETHAGSFRLKRFRS